MAKITDATIAQILACIGGSQNIALCGNCMTRLRLTLRERSLVDHAKLKKIPSVMGVIEGNDQLQIVLGPGKAQTASEMMNILLAQNHASQEIEAKPADLHTLAAANKQQLKSKQRS
ncbi:MAG: PTS transporter subunit EIIB, partial [Hafnia sp.]